MPVHTIEEGLAQFELIAGVGDGARTACAMSLLAWIDGCSEWTDAPECAHRLIREHVVRANDAAGVTTEMRAELVKAGQTGILDTWWVPDSIIALALTSEKGKPRPKAYPLALTLVNRITEWKVNKPHADLRGADLRSADLRGAYLRGAYLRGAYLTGADLRGAYLRGAYLRGADLTGADLRGADLTGADLRGAYLRGAYLTDAYLTDAKPWLPAKYEVANGRLVVKAGA